MSSTYCAAACIIGIGAGMISCSNPIGTASAPPNLEVTAPAAPPIATGNVIANETIPARNSSREPIIGATKHEVIEMFTGWERRLSYEQKVDPNAVKFQNSDLIVVVDFDTAGRAEGVSFLTTRPDDLTGRTSYVNQHYDELIAWATGGANVPVKNNRTTQFPVEVYIGKLHD